MMGAPRDWSQTSQLSHSAVKRTYDPIPSDNYKNEDEKKSMNNLQDSDNRESLIALNISLGI